MGNFAYIEQIPILYADFCEINDTDDVFEFMEEQFCEFTFAGEEDEPFEKEAKPVPFHSTSMQVFVAFVEPVNTEFIHTEKTKRHNFIYILKEYWVDASSVYHPPKSSLA
jgi:hypothetical protein